MGVMYASDSYRFRDGREGAFPRRGPDLFPVLDGKFRTVGLGLPLLLGRELDFDMVS